MFKAIVVRLSAVTLLCCLSICAFARADEPKRVVNIPAGDLSVALNLLAKQSGVELMYRPEQVRGMKTRGAKGDLTAREAVMLLLKGTPLELRTEASGALLIAAPMAAAASDPNRASGSPNDPTKEAGKKSSQDFRVAQVVQGQTSGPSTIENQGEEPPRKKSVLEEVVVTGSRLKGTTEDRAFPVHVITRDQIDAMGVTNVAEALNSLPQVSQSSTGSSFQNNNAYGNNSVQLRGQSAGATLVLINGQRTGAFAAAGGNDGFNIGNIPLAAVDRIEVVPTGSSAIYGGDALAGVVNVILKKNFNGLDVSASYGAADNTNEKNAALAYGLQFDAGSLALIGSYQATTPLAASDRSFFANGNFTAIGGPDYRHNASALANLYSLTGQNLPGLTGPEASVPPGSSGIGLTPADFRATTGVVNETFLLSTGSLIPDAQKYSALLTGQLRVAGDVELFSDTLYSHSRINSDNGKSALTFGEYGQQFASANNPFNPFGVDVGVNYVFNGYDQCTCVTEQYFRPVLGARGDISNGWTWELSGLYSSDRLESVVANTINPTAVQNALSSSNPATALNVFKDGPAGSAELLNSLFTSPIDSYRTTLKSATGFVSGPVVHLSSGDVQTVVGSQVEWSDLEGDITSSGSTQYTGSRRFYAFFGEFRLPIIGPPAGSSVGDKLAIQGAVRHDSYSDFGSRTSPQVALEFRPVESLLLRASYSSAFKPPPLIDLLYPQTTYPNFLQYFSLTDPERGGAPVAGGSWIIGGNANLQATTGHTSAFGLVFAPRWAQGVRASVTDWMLTIDNAVESPNLQYLIDNERTLPGRVIRGPSQSGQPGIIESINDTFISLGSTEESGIDFDVSYRAATRWGEWTSALSATDTYKYVTVVAPGTPATNNVSAANFNGYAPKWKGVATLGWRPEPALQLTLFAHYVSSYRDFAPLLDGSYLTLGNFWTFDGSASYDLSKILRIVASHIPSAVLTLGVVDATNKLPVFSMYGYYDPTQYDARGRYIYARIEVKY